MSDENPLGNIAQVFSNLDDSALQSLFNQAKGELAGRQTARVHDIFTSLMEANTLAGNKEKDNSECSAYRDPKTDELLGVQVSLTLDARWSLPENLHIWGATLTALKNNFLIFDFQIHGGSSGRYPVEKPSIETIHVAVSFKVLGLQSVPGLLEVEDSTSLTMVLKAYEYLEKEVEPLQVNEDLPAEEE